MLKLYFMSFQKENKENKYTTFEEGLKPKVDYDKLSENDITIIDLRRNEIYTLSRQSVEDYLVEGSFTDGNFPDQTRMTGNYYVRSEYYGQREDGSYNIGIFFAFTEIFQSEKIAPFETDYLGLEVWLDAVSLSGEFQVYGIDSSSI